MSTFAVVMLCVGYTAFGLLTACRVASHYAWKMVKDRHDDGYGRRREWHQFQPSKENWTAGAALGFMAMFIWPAIVFIYMTRGQALRPPREVVELQVKQERTELAKRLGLDDEDELPQLNR